MRILFATDLHIRETDDWWKNTLDVLRDAVLTVKPDLLVLGGDLFHTRKPSPELLYQARIWLRVLPRELPVVVMMGNHDAASIGGRSPIDVVCGQNSASMSSAFVVNDFDSIRTTAVTRPMAMKTEAANLIFMPWIGTDGLALPDGTMEEQAGSAAQATYQAIALLKSEMDPALPTLLFLHQMILEASFGEYQVPWFGGKDVVLSEPDLRLTGVDMVLSGHVHRRQTIGIVHYAGAMDRLDFGDEAETRGYTIIDVDGEDIVLHDVDRADPREFVTYEYGLGYGMTQVEEWNPGFGSTVRVRYECTSVEAQTIDHIGIQKAIEGKGAAFHGFVPKIIEETSRVRDDQMTGEISPAEALRRYADNQRDWPAETVSLGEQLVEKATHAV